MATIAVIRTDHHCPNAERPAFDGGFESFSGDRSVRSYPENGTKQWNVTDVTVGYSMSTSYRVVNRANVQRIENIFERGKRISTERETPGYDHRRVLFVRWLNVRFVVTVHGEWQIVR